MILVNNDTKLVVQGITGSEGSFHTTQMLEYGTQVVAGVTPGKGGQKTEAGVPIFNTVQEAKNITQANTSVIFVPPPFAADAIMEAVDADLDLVICITEGIPTADMVKVHEYMAGKKTRMVGPNCPGVISPGAGKIGIMPGFIHQQGKVGVISRSGTLTYEAVHQLSSRGIGQSTCIGIGGDPINGSSHRKILEKFEQDPETKVVLMIGEIGGPQEIEAGIFAKEQMTKPVVAYIAGLTAPKGRRMGHAGAIISSTGESASEKVEQLLDMGVTIAPTPSAMGETVAKVIANL